MPKSNRKCSYPGCKKKHVARGLCKNHYNSAKAKGKLAQFPTEEDKNHLRKNHVARAKRPARPPPAAVDVAVDELVATSLNQLAMKFFAEDRYRAAIMVRKFALSVGREA